MVELDPGAGGIADLFPEYDYASDFFYPSIARPWSGVSPNSLGVSLGNLDRNLGFTGVLAAGIFLPKIPSEYTGTEEGDIDEPVNGNGTSDSTDPSLPGYVIDPRSRPEWVTMETQFPTPAPYPPPVRLPSQSVPELIPELEEVTDVAWTDIITAGIGAIGQYQAQEQAFGFAQQVAAAQAAPSINQQIFGAADETVPTNGAGNMMAGNCSTCPPNGPRYGKICIATGEITPLRRRRKKKLLTNSDLSCIAALKALVGGGAALNAAVVKAMR